MNVCFICKEPIKEKSVEHIIPNALGGKLKAAILCKNHNSSFGSRADVDLVNSLAVFTNLLNPKRERGNNPNLTFESNEGNIVRSASGETLLRIVEKEAQQRYFIKILGKNVEEKAKKAAQKIIKNIAKKEKWSVDTLNQSLRDIEKKIEGEAKIVPHPEMRHDVALGEGQSWLSIIKTAIGYGIKNNVNKKYLSYTTDILINNDLELAKSISGFYYPDIYNNKSICHTLVLIGNNHAGVLYCLVSLYNIFNSLVILSTKYEGQDFQNSYCHDLMKNKIVENKMYVPILNKEKLLLHIKPACNNYELLSQYVNSFFQNLNVDYPC